MNPPLWFLILVIFVLQGLAVYTWQFRSEPGARWGMLTMISGMGMLLCLVLLSISESDKARIDWVTCFAATSYFSPFFWFIKIVEVSGFRRISKRWVYWLAAVTSVLCVLCILCTRWTGWYWDHIWIRNGSEVCRTLGPLHALCRGSGYCFHLATIAILLCWVWKSVGIRRQQACLFLLASILFLLDAVFAALPGFDPVEASQRIGHHGLQIMQERVNEIRGELRVHSTLGAGTELCVAVPISLA